MDAAALTDQLFQQNEITAGDYLSDQDALKRFLVDMLDVYFDTYHEEHYGYDRINLPEVYVQFLHRSARTNVQLGGPYGMTIFGWPAMLYNTYYWANLYKGEEQERYWISIGIRGDKHFLFMSCDVKSPLFGTVVDFHDATPWIEDYPLPDSPEKSDYKVYGTFTQLMEYMLER